jgi:S-adenosyl methyltransferase
VAQGTPPARTDGSKLPPFDPSVPNPARMWNYWLGGKDNFAADREAAERVLEAMPSLPLIARAARLFLIDAVHQLATEHGIRQFLDIGTGLPTADNTHDVAQRAAPESKIVYVDYDPVVLTHAQALLTSSPEGQTDYIQADLRDTDTILKAAARTLDLTRPLLHWPGPAPTRPGPHQPVGPHRSHRRHQRCPGRLQRHRPQTLSIRAS